MLDRFRRTKDEAAFSALVQRFGPMVLGVCRQILDDPHAAEDAFQAVFLVLVRRAGSIRDGQLLGNWLYGVALKVARRARADRLRRLSREAEGLDVADQPTADGPDDLDRLDLGPILHDEVGRLPEKYRAPIVLCFLDGRTHDEAAQLLKWPVGTVKGRLARAKDLLRDRLGRRGVTVASAVIVASFAKASGAAVPASLAESTIKAAMGVAAGGAGVAGACSAGAWSLSEGVVRSMATTKIKILAAALVASGTIATGAGVMARQDQPNPPVQGVRTEKTATEKVSNGGVPPEGQVGKTEVTTEKGAIKVEPAPADELAQLLKGLPPNDGPFKSVDQLKKERVEAAKRALDLAVASHRTGSSGFDSVLKAARALSDAQANATNDFPARIEALKQSVRLARALASSAEALARAGEVSEASVAQAQLDVLDAELRFAQPQVGEAPPPRVGGGFGGGSGGEAGGEAGGGFGGGDAGGAIDRGPDPEDEDDADRDEAIMKVLSNPVAMPFANETPLGELIKYVKTATVNANMPEGIPIYLDPEGLQMAEKTIDSPISLNLEGIKLKTTLRLALKQLGLGYYVRHGLLIITSLDDFSLKDANDPQWRERARNRMQSMGAMGGMGGMGAALPKNAAPAGGGFRSIGTTKPTPTRP